MQALEKILQEIEEEAMHNPEIGRKQCKGMEKAMNIIGKHMNDDKCGECSRRKWYQKGYEDGKKDNNGWIPCSEMMPEEPGDYRVTIMEKWKCGEVEYHSDFAYFPGDYIDDLWDTFNDWKEGQEVNVIAWKKIEDEPYKPPAESPEEKRMREREEFFKEAEQI